MKKIKSLFLLSALLIIAIASHATWSIIIIDEKTGAIGVAGASCTNSVYGVATIVPGKGAVIVQAMSNGMARVRGVEMLRANASPQEILKALMDPSFYPEQQQYAIVSLLHPDASATYTGESAHQHKGSLTARGISVQGNILAAPDVLQKVLDAALKAKAAGLPLEQQLMLALEAGATAGGDSRCGEYRASSAFITIMKKDDDAENPCRNIIVNKIDDHTNAVNELRAKLDKLNQPTK